MATELFVITNHQGIGVLELDVPGDMDPMVIDKLILEIEGKMEASTCRHWVIDLAKVAYLNSAGLGFLCNLREKIRRNGGNLILCGLSHQLLGLFKSCCLERLFRITRTRDEAMCDLAN